MEKLLCNVSPSAKTVIFFTLSVIIFSIISNLIYSLFGHDNGVGQIGFISGVISTIAAVAALYIADLSLQLAFKGEYPRRTVLMTVIIVWSIFTALQILTLKDALYPKENFRVLASIARHLATIAIALFLRLNKSMILISTLKSEQEYGPTFKQDLGTAKGKIWAIAKVGLTLALFYVISSLIAAPILFVLFWNHYEWFKQVNLYSGSVSILCTIIGFYLADLLLQLWLQRKYLRRQVLMTLIIISTLGTLLDLLNAKDGILSMDNIRSFAIIFSGVYLRFNKSLERVPDRNAKAKSRNFLSKSFVKELLACVLIISLFSLWAVDFEIHLLHHCQSALISARSERLGSWFGWLGAFWYALEMFWVVMCILVFLGGTFELLKDRFIFRRRE